jgi:DNA-directed RNA polymerase subunit H (RpoH/RPB5)
MTTTMRRNVLLIGSKNKSAEIIVVRDERAKAIGVSVLREYAEVLNACHLRHIFLILNQALTSHAVKDSRGEGSDPQISNIRWEIPNVGTLLYCCIDSSTTAVKHTVLPEHEIQLRELKLGKRGNWAKLKTTDPIARYFGCLKGDVMEYILKESQGMATELRICE